MSEICIKYIDKEHASDINIKNEAFKLWGCMLPSYQDGKWSYSTIENEKIEWDIFPDENYNFDEMEKDYIFIGAYDGADCRYAKEQGYRGVWTIGQDNNLSACLFYINSGFRIGGLDTDVYNGTKQEGKADIYFYKEAE